MQIILQLGFLTRTKCLKWSEVNWQQSVVSSHRISFEDNEILWQHFNESRPAVRLCFLHNFMDRDSTVNGAQVVSVNSSLKHETRSEMSYGMDRDLGTFSKFWFA